MIVPKSLRLGQKSMLSRAAMIRKNSKLGFSKAFNKAVFLLIKPLGFLLKIDVYFFCYRKQPKKLRYH